jgi:hypothetical protein
MILNAYINIFRNGINGVIWLSEKSLPAHTLSIFNYHILAIEDYKFPSLNEYKIAEEADIPFIIKGLNKGKYLTPIFDEIYALHYFIKYPIVVRSLIIGNSFCSYYIRDTSSGIRCAYLFYFFTEEIDYKTLIECCIHDALKQGILRFLVSDTSINRRKIITEMKFIKGIPTCYYYSNINLPKTDDIDLVLI